MTRLDTDSLYIKIGDFIKNNFADVFGKLSDEKQLEFVADLAFKIQDYVNDRIFTDVQLVEYNSKVSDFKIELKHELIARTALFLKKKRYAYWAISEDKIPTDKITVKGIEIIRSDTPSLPRKFLKDVLELIIKGKPDEDIKKLIDICKQKMLECEIEELAANIGIPNDINKYLQSNEYEIKLGLKNKSGGTLGIPWHVQGLVNYRKLIKQFKLENEFEWITRGTKAKVIYVKKNPFGFKSISFSQWPKKFEDEGILPDRQLMIEKYFTNKIEDLVEPLHKQYLLSDNYILNNFF